MNRLPREKQAQIVRCLVEGNSLRSTTRMVGCSINTVTKLLVELGAACNRFHDFAVKGVGSRRIQCDEIWAFCYSKQKNIPERLKGMPGIGSVWTWTAMCAESKLMIAYHVGTRDADCANHFMHDLSFRLANRVQLTTDGHKCYLEAVDLAFGHRIDYAMLIKIYGEASDEHRYSPGECVGTRKAWISGSPDPNHTSTSYIERQNLTMRMGMRRFTRLTNAFSKKVENHEASVALHFAYYNWVRIHKTLRVTPAMEAGLASRIWEIEDLLKLLNWTPPSN